MTWTNGHEYNVHAEQCAPVARVNNTLNTQTKDVCPTFFTFIMNLAFDKYLMFLIVHDQ